MTQLEYQTRDFAYDTVSDPSGLPARVAIYADRASARAQIADDLGGAGFRTVDGGDIANLLDGPIALLGDVVMVDCPVIEGRTLAALARLDMRVARSGAKLIVATSIEALDGVFAALDQCNPQILVEPGRGERIVAVGRVLADIGNARVREMTEDDRLNLLHLSHQVEAIARQLDRLTGHRASAEDGGANRLNDGKPGFRGQEPNPLLVRHNGGPAARPPLPDPRLVRRVISARQARARYFDGELFADPA